MKRDYDTIIIGAGHNGLVTAAYLARAGLRVLVLERREVVGGAAVTEEVFPGFRVDACAPGVRWLHPKVVRELQLKRHGLRLFRSNPTVFAPSPDGRHLMLWREPGKAVKAIRQFSEADAGQWGEFSEQVARMAGFLRSLYTTMPPQVMNMDAADLLSLARLGGRLRLLGGDDMVEVLRGLPMSVAEFLDEWFETDVLKGTLGASGITGLFQGPLAAGTAYLFLHHHVGSEKGAFRAIEQVQGGIGRLTQALAEAGRQHGVEIRTGAEVARVMVRDGRVAGVALTNGQEIAAPCVVSNTDPRRTFLSLVDPLHLEPQFLRSVRNIKFRGACAKVNLALDGLPNFSGWSGRWWRRSADARLALRSVISISPSLEYLERACDDAKYGEPSLQPYLEVLIPSLSDSTFAPDGKHVMSIFVQYAPYHLKEGTWDSVRRETLGDTVIDTLATYAPNLKDIILHRQVLTPLDLEQTYGLTEGNIYHGEMMLDQLFFMRPVPGWARYRTPIEGLYLCGAGTHPGGGVTGGPGYNATREVLKDIKRKNGSI